MRTSHKIIVGVALAGFAAAGGAAFTGAGLVNTADPAQFIGGSVAQTVTGATLASVAYTYNEEALGGTPVTQVDLVFSGAPDDSVVTIVADSTGTTTAVWTCTDVVANASECTITTGAQVGLASVDITVAAA